MRYRVGGTSGPFPSDMFETMACAPTPGRLALAKMVAVRLFRAHEQRFKRTFRRSCTRRYRCKPSAVDFEPLHKPLSRIRRARLVNGRPDILGMTDGTHIWVSTACTFTFEALIRVLVHEALHSWCWTRGRWLPARHEHVLMRALGDDC